MKLKSHIFIGDRRKKEEATHVIISEDDTNPYASCPTTVMGSKHMIVGRYVSRPDQNRKLLQSSEPPLESDLPPPPPPVNRLGRRREPTPPPPPPDVGPTSGN
ncbi:hypothetical protein AgCh_001930 [Apium graveolens]